MKSQLHSKKLLIITHSIFLHVSKNLEMILQTLLFFGLKYYPLILHFVKLRKITIGKVFLSFSKIDT